VVDEVVWKQKHCKELSDCNQNMAALKDQVEPRAQDACEWRHKKS